MNVLLISCGDVGIETGFRFQTRGAQVTAWRRNPQLLPATFRGQGVDMSSGQLPPIDPQTEVVLFTPVPATRDAEGYRRSYLQTAELLVAALRAGAPRLRRLFYVSSTAVNAGDNGQWVNELHPKAPTRPTAQVLADTEDFLLASGLPVTILRASGIYGPGRTRLVDSLREGSARLPSAAHWTNRIHRDDLAKAVVHLAELGDEAAELYLATDNRPVLLEEVYTHLAGLLGVAPPLRDDAAVRRTDANRRLSNIRLRSTGWEPTFADFRDGYRAVLLGTSRRHS